MAVGYRTRGLVLLALALGMFSLAGVQGQPQPAPAETITYQDVVKLFRAGKSEQEILDILGKTTVKVEFILGDTQVQELQKMRVTDDFINALKQRLSKSSGDVTDFAIILDCSGSMMEKTREGITKMEAAKKTVADLIQKIPNGLRVAFIVYGHDVSLKCEAVKVVRPLSELDDAGKAELVKFIYALQPVGHTPIALALRVAGKELAKSKGLADVYLITDGMETCDGDPAKEAAELVNNLNLKSGVNVIGFGLENLKEREAVAKIAKAGKGKYYDARSAKELFVAVAEVEKKIVQARPAPVQEVKPAVVESWVQLFNGKDLSGWKTHPSEPGMWQVTDGILIGRGKNRSHLFSERDDYEDFHYRIEAKISNKGNSGQYFRTEFGPGYPKGYEAQINSSHSDPIRTGSLYGKVPIMKMLVPPDTWFTQEVIAKGNHIQIFVNGQKTVDYTDAAHRKGHFAIQQHTPAAGSGESVIMVKKIEVKELK